MGFGHFADALGLSVSESEHHVHLIDKVSNKVSDEEGQKVQTQDPSSNPLDERWCGFISTACKWIG
jgi:hypothetical protein